MDCIFTYYISGHRNNAEKNAYIHTLVENIENDSNPIERRDFWLEIPSVAVYFCRN